MRSCREAKKVCASIPKVSIQFSSNTTCGCEFTFRRVPFHHQSLLEVTGRCLRQDFFRLLLPTSRSSQSISSICYREFETRLSYLGKKRAAEDKITKNNHFLPSPARTKVLVFIEGGCEGGSKNMPNIVCFSCFKELNKNENIFSCSKKHRFCAPCGKSMHLQCEVKCPENCY
jgi:hypothetical protein